MAKGKARHRNSQSPKPLASQPTMTVADYFKHKLGWKSNRANLVTKGRPNGVHCPTFSLAKCEYGTGSA